MSYESFAAQPAQDLHCCHQWEIISH